MTRSNLSKYSDDASYLTSGSQSSFQSGIRCRDLHVCYGRHVAIENLTGVFEPGTLTAIVGPNGGGKSTLLKVMNGTQQPERGKLEIETEKKA